MMPIARRILEAKNDACRYGEAKVPTAARISPTDMRQLESWVRQQNRPHVTGLPAQQLDAKHLWGMDIVEDPAVRDVIVLEFPK